MNQQQAAIGQHQDTQSEQCRYRRYCKLIVRPIQSQQSYQSDRCQQTDMHLSQVYSYQESIEEINTEKFVQSDQEIQTKQRTIIQKIKKKAKLKIQKKPYKRSIKSKLNKENDLDIFEWNNSYQSLPQECLQVNQSHKNRSYHQLQDSIVGFVNNQYNTNIIFVSGESSTAKKTIIINILRNIRQRFDFKQHSLTFEETINSDVVGKAQGFCQFLRSTVSLQEINGQRKKIFLLSGYQSFILALKKCSLLKQFQKLTANKSNLFIMIDSNIAKKQILLIATHQYHKVEVQKNTKKFFMESMLAMVNHYNYCNHNWQLLRPLANFFSTKMESNNTLSLSIIRKFVVFLQAQEIKMENDEEKVRVSREIVEKFMECISDRKAPVDLKRLTIHQKAAITGCYSILKEQPGLLISMGKAYNAYVWVCNSIGMKPKEITQFTRNLIYQMEIYQILRLQQVSQLPKRREILVNLDLDWIRNYLQDQYVLSRFFQD